MKISGLWENKIFFFFVFTFLFIWNSKRQKNLKYWIFIKTENFYLFFNLLSSQFNELNSRTQSEAAFFVSIYLFDLLYLFNFFLFFYYNNINVYFCCIALIVIEVSFAFTDDTTRFQIVCFFIRIFWFFKQVELKQLIHYFSINNNRIYSLKK